MSTQWFDTFKYFEMFEIKFSKLFRLSTKGFMKSFKCLEYLSICLTFETFESSFRSDTSFEATKESWQLTLWIFKIQNKYETIKIYANADISNMIQRLWSAQGPSDQRWLILSDWCGTSRIHTPQFQIFERTSCSRQKRHPPKNIIIAHHSKKKTHSINGKCARIDFHLSTFKEHNLQIWIPFSHHPDQSFG